MEAAESSTDLDEILRLPPDVRISRLILLGQALKRAGRPAPPPALRAMVSLVEEGYGTPQTRLDLGEILGILGDPRLRFPSEADYWVPVATEEGPVRFGRYPVTNQEMQRFVADGGYTRREAWSEEGWAWLSGCPDPWTSWSEDPGAAAFIVPNQPVVGVSWYEADAYARSVGARLPRFDERVAAIRGACKRKYPWGEPFGGGNANTREEVLGRPCAVGLFRADRTPDGVVDLAGNVAEWAADGPEGHGPDLARWYAPGAWDQPSLASWVKAIEMEHPSARSASRGFRLVRS